MNKIIIFDFDGVIVNSCQLSFDINKEMFADIEFEEIKTWAEGNVYSQKLRDDYSEFNVRSYFEQYHNRVAELMPVGGVEEVFKKIKDLGYKLVIISSSSESSIDNFLVKYDLRKYFEEILAKETHNGKVEKFKMVLEKYKIKPEDTLMITDSIGDVKEAIEVKIKTIGVGWGIHEGERLKENGADFVAKKPEDIVIGIKKILALN